MSQRQYAVNLLEQFNMSDCKPVSTPMLPGLVLTKEMGAKTEEESKQYKAIYLSAVGSLMYLATQTRVDIAGAVEILCRLNGNPGAAHWKAVKHLFRYIQGTLDYKLTYTKSSSPLSFVTYTDADHGGCKDSGKSTGGYVMTMNGAPANCSLQSLSPLLKQSTLLEWKLARRPNGCAACCGNWGIC